MTESAEPGDLLKTLGQGQHPEAPAAEAAAGTTPPAAAPDAAAAKPADKPAAKPAARNGDLSLPPRRVRREGDELHRMVVGREIKLSGTISACDQLLVEGTIEADLKDCDDLQIAETGLFKGSAALGEADIRGRFEGTLVVRNLVIRSSAKVTGKIRYAQLQIERGGQISGDVVAIEGDDGAA
jgi:cytoskeletal protein CcmA (bactofilin family)